jgi:SAM-dependent methyltransferase
MELNKEYWDNRYSEGNTGWDVGEATTPLKEYINQLTNKDTAILIPGGGSAYEAQYLAEKGFTDITVLDISEEVVDELKKRFANDAHVKVLQGDFFEHKGTYDLVLEQTFFCALNPVLRKNYYEQMHNILNARGKIAGVMFGVEFEKEGPPFGGNKQEYKVLMENYFRPKTLELCYNSIPQRAGNELFVILERMG